MEKRICAHSHGHWDTSGNRNGTSTLNYQEQSSLLPAVSGVFLGKCRSHIPYVHPLHVVAGKPIEVRKTLQPTNEEISKVHGQFVEALKNLFERHRARAWFSDLQLNIL